MAFFCVMCVADSLINGIFRDLQFKIHFNHFIEKTINKTIFFPHKIAIFIYKWNNSLLGSVLICYSSSIQNVETTLNNVEQCSGHCLKVPQRENFPLCPAFVLEHSRHAIWQAVCKVKFVFRFFSRCANVYYAVQHNFYVVSTFWTLKWVWSKYLALLKHMLVIGWY